MSKALEDPFLAIGGLELASAPSPPRGAEVLRRLRELSAYDLMHDVTVEALAAHLTPPRLDRALPPCEEMSLHGLRCGLIQAGVPLPGSLRAAVIALEKAETPSTFNAQEILHAAHQRRRALEEVCLWVTWMQHLERASPSNTVIVTPKPSSAVAPSTDSPLATEMWDVLERGGEPLLECFGIPLGHGPSIQAISSLCQDVDVGAVSSRNDAKRPGNSLDVGRFSSLLALLRTTAENLPDPGISSWPLTFRGHPVENLAQLQVHIPLREVMSLEPEKPAKASCFEGRRSMP